MKKMSDMDALGLILDIGREMILCGAETHRVEDSLYRICRSFRFTDANIWVIPSNIQATVQTEDGHCITQVRHIRYIVSIDFRRLEMLNELSRSICSGAVSPEEVRDVLGRISSCRSASPAVSCAAAALASSAAAIAASAPAIGLGRGNIGTSTFVRLNSFSHLVQ